MFFLHRWIFLWGGRALFAPTDYPMLFEDFELMLYEDGTPMLYDGDS